MSSIGSGNSAPLGSRFSESAKEAQAKNKESKAVLGVNNIKDLASQIATMGAANLGTPGPLSIPVLAGTSTAIGIGSLAGSLIGGALKLPGNEVYTIKEGDTLTDIAKKSLGDKATPDQINKFIEEITDLNSDIIQDKNKIYTGDTIAIPDSGIKAGEAPGNTNLFD